MLYIEKDASSKLPEKYHGINNICAIIYDQIVEIFALENYESLQHTKFEYDREKHILIDELENEEIHVIKYPVG